MSTVQALIDSIKLHVRDPLNVEVTSAQLQVFINDAADDARNSGWVIHLEDDESLLFSSNLFEYAVPATFAYIHELRVEDNTTSPSTWSEVIPQAYWDIRIDATVPKIFFTPYFAIPTGMKMKVIGQKRPSSYSAVGDTVDPGMNSFLRERASSYALSFMASGRGELDQTRLGMSEVKFRNSELLLSRHPAEFRVLPSSKYVLGR